MRRAVPLALAVLALILSPALADDPPAKPPEAPPAENPPPANEPPPAKAPPPEEIKPATDAQAKHELEVFKRDFATEDIDFLLEAVVRLSKCVHENVTKELLNAALKHPDPHVRAEAIRGLKRQKPYVKSFMPKLLPLLKDEDLDAKVLAQVVLTVGFYGWRPAWEEVCDLLAHDDDTVVANCFFVLGEWRELRACDLILEFWSAYPSEGSWSTGSVRVDTGAAGNEDANAAKAKWMAKYGSKGKQRARAECVKALKEAVHKITETAMEESAEFKRWIDEHEADIKAAKRRRD